MKIKTVLKKLWPSSPYRIILNPDREKLNKEFSSAWQNDFLALKQTAKAQDQMGRFRDVAPMHAAIHALKKIPHEGKTILDIGCASGYYNEVFEKAGLNLKYSGCDYSRKFIELARLQYPKTYFSVCDATHLTFKTAEFDIAFSGCCILHMIEYGKAIAETARVAKEYAVFHRTPVVHTHETFFAEKIAYNTKMFHIFFNEEELFDLFTKNGLAVLHADTHGQEDISGIPESIFTKTYVCKKLF